MFFMWAGSSKGYGQFVTPRDLLQHRHSYEPPSSEVPLLRRRVPPEDLGPSSRPVDGGRISQYAVFDKLSSYRRSSFVWISTIRKRTLCRTICSSHGVSYSHPLLLLSPFSTHAQEQQPNQAQDKQLKGAVIVPPKDRMGDVSPGPWRTRSRHV
jgi:hypothetical protein